MRIYLAARYTRGPELRGYREQLRTRGHIVHARWLNGSHQLDNQGNPIGDNGELLFESGQAPDELRLKFAIDDRDDVLSSERLIAFTEPPRSGHSRGGRHVELGIAIGARIPATVVGPRENVFTWLPEITYYETWDECLADL